MRNKPLKELSKYIVCSFKETNTSLSELKLQKIIYNLDNEDLFLDSLNKLTDILEMNSFI